MIPKAFLYFLLLGFCSIDAAEVKNSLYSEIGGAKAVERIVENTMKLAHTAPQISFHFEDIDEENLRTQLIAQLCHLTGGPCAYHGLDMEEAHAGMEITKAEFEYFVGIFIKALEQSDISFSAQNKLLALLAPMRNQIIEQ